jgi:hypothetical protein
VDQGTASAHEPYFLVLIPPSGRARLVRANLGPGWHDSSIRPIEYSKWQTSYREGIAKEGELPMAKRTHLTVTILEATGFNRDLELGGGITLPIATDHFDVESSIFGETPLLSPKEA